jgi:hypothetical protein
MSSWIFKGKKHFVQGSNVKTILIYKKKLMKVRVVPIGTLFQQFEANWYHLRNASSQVDTRLSYTRLALRHEAVHALDALILQGCVVVDLLGLARAQTFVS